MGGAVLSRRWRDLCSPVVVLFMASNRVLVFASTSVSRGGRTVGESTANTRAEEHRRLVSRAAYFFL